MKIILSAIFRDEKDGPNFVRRRKKFRPQCKFISSADEIFFIYALSSTRCLRNGFYCVKSGEIKACFHFFSDIFAVNWQKCVIFALEYGEWQTTKCGKTSVPTPYISDTRILH